MYDIIIIGAGAAGLTAAIYACRANKKTLVLEAKAYGGVIVETKRIENYPVTPHISGIDFAKNLYQQATELGAEVEFEEVTAIEIISRDSRSTDSSSEPSIASSESRRNLFKITTDDDTYEAKAVIIAGGSVDRKLGLPYEKELTGHGISYCATCDGALYKGKTVAVNGGGNTALYDALYLSDVAEKVYLIHRRNEFRADPALVEKVRKKTNIEFIMNSVVSELDGKKHLESIKIVPSDIAKPKLAATSPDAATKPERAATSLDADTTKSEQTLEVSALFVAIGRNPATKVYQGILDLDPSGYIISDENCRTNIDGIFVAGDIRTKNIRQLVTATADGAVAASAAAEYLN